MIQFIDKKDCCGCNACTQKCPTSCITMNEDNEGFLYPKVNIELCIKCGLCKNVCPVIHQGKEQRPLCTYATKNNNESVRINSSSGGIFSLLAEYVLSQKGIVFGARFNECWEIIHDYTEIIEGIVDFRGSKYVQSKIGNSFLKTKQFLKSGRLVLFSGTPCQIAGLKLFLEEDYENLLTVDFVCHGVPSPKIWRIYLQELIDSKTFGKKISKTLSNNYSINEIANIEFRNKSLGWKRFSFLIDIYKQRQRFVFSEPLDENIFMKGFLNDLYLRPSCYACPAKCFKNHSDITIGDYWGIENILPKFDDDRGVSLVMINTKKALDICENMDATFIETSYENALSGNPAIEKSAKTNSKRLMFFDNLDKMHLFKLINKLTKVSLFLRFKTKIIVFLNKF